MSTGFMALIFAFGIAAGFLIAFSGLGFLQDSGAIILTVFLSALFVVSLVGIALVVMRRPLWRKLFGVAESQMEMIAEPLLRVAEGVIARDPGVATAAAGDFARMVLARYAWITARRWLMVSLTALIAAMAALAGTALLFKQNQLLEVQSALLSEQNARIQEQTGLLAQDVQLAEAARNAALAVEITQIAALVGEVATAVRAEFGAAVGAAAGDQVTMMFNALDPTELGQGLTLRIVSASRATRPYLFLDLGYRAEDISDKTRVAMLRRRGDLGQTYARLAEANGWQEPGPQNQLVDRPASPERGQLLRVLIAGGIRNLAPLNFVGLDLSFAYMQNADLSLMTAQGGLMSYADFSGSHIIGSDLGGAWLENVRFRGCRIERTSFADITADRVQPPFRPEEGTVPSFLAGADFEAAALIDVSFAEADLLAANFDGALLVRPDFSGSILGAATLRGAVLLAPEFAGATLKSVDLDGAVVFGTDFLPELMAAAEPDSFVAARYVAAPVTLAEVMALPVVDLTLTEDEVVAISGGAPAFRLQRIQPFEN